MFEGGASELGSIASVMSQPLPPSDDPLDKVLSSYCQKFKLYEVYFVLGDSLVSNRLVC